MAFTETTYREAREQALAEHEEFIKTYPDVPTEYEVGGVSLYRALLDNGVGCMGGDGDLQLIPFLWDRRLLTVSDAKLRLRLPDTLQLLTKEQFKEAVEIGSLVEERYTDCSVEVVLKFIKAFGEIKQPIKLGRWIKKHFSELNDDAIRKVVEATAPEKMYVTFVKTKCALHYRVMREVCSLSSCMSHSLRFYGQYTQEYLDSRDKSMSSREMYHHPVDCYDNSPNSRLALFSFKDPRKVTEGYPFRGRSVFNLDSLEYVRVYGDTRIGGPLPMGNCEGILLHRIQAPDGQMMPYIDTENRADAVVVGGVEYWECKADEDDGEYRSDYNNGLAEEVSGNWCAHCEEYHDRDDDDFIEVVGVGTVYGGCSEFYHSPMGYDEYYFENQVHYSDYHMEYIHEDDVVYTVCGHVAYHTDDIGDVIVCCEDDEYREKEECVYSHFYEEYIPKCDAVRNAEGDWMWSHEVDEWNAENCPEENEDVA